MLDTVPGPPEWAETAGTDRSAFRRAMSDPANCSWLVEIKKEGIVNSVQHTPTVFMNGRRYQAELTCDEVIDVLEAE